MKNVPLNGVRIVTVDLPWESVIIDVHPREGTVGIDAPFATTCVTKDHTLVISDAPPARIEGVVSNVVSQGGNAVGINYGTVSNVHTIGAAGGRHRNSSDTVIKVPPGVTVLVNGGDFTLTDRALEANIKVTGY